MFKELLIDIMRFLYVLFICFSASAVSVVIIFLNFDIDADNLKSFYITIGFMVHLIILDLFFFKSKSFFRGMFRKKENKEEHW